MEVIEVFHGFTWFHMVLQDFPQFGSLQCTSAKEYAPGDDGVNPPPPPAGPVPLASM